MTVTREAVLEMLAAFGERAPQQVDEEIGSLELTWLLSEAEQRYGVELDPESPELATVHTVGQAVAALQTLVPPQAALAPSRPPASAPAAPSDSPSSSSTRALGVPPGRRPGEPLLDGQRLPDAAPVADV
ncbi:hypothetical protein C7C46_15100 [Streptomyces tateyamensis]|uniref:Uncharacterized protein n=1 Tax=Streptomyces tateyamensis TaxID=565073 RepID=A0A2V4P3C6_9ACTN|nr:hypothetical protein [Streptomyces tateyamensis]PYC78843.1 hypothetical protein C7C46_15100 [Streptomyces tateyamensis]